MEDATAYASRVLLYFLTTGLPLLIGMLLVAYLAWRGSSVAMVALVFLTVVWLRVDKRFEGPHVFRINQDHGLVVSDVAGLLVLIAGGLAWLSTRRAARHTREDQSEESAVG